MAQITPAYKHLDSKTRIWEFTAGQWVVLFLGLLGGLTYIVYLHPVSFYFSLATGVYIAGLPFAAAVLASLYEFSLYQLVRAFIAWRRHPRISLPGSGRPTSGYLLHPEPPRVRRALDTDIDHIDPRALWDY